MVGGTAIIGYHSLPMNSAASSPSSPATVTTASQTNVLPRITGFENATGGGDSDWGYGKRQGFSEKMLGGQVGTQKKKLAR